MRPVDAELLRLLAHMPLLDRLEMVAVSGWSRGGVYKAVPRLEDAGLIASVPHGTDLIPPTRRFHLTADGLRRLAHAENVPLEALLRDLPVSARWRRVLLERLDAVAVVYRLASAVSNAAYPIRFRWYRARPLDAIVILAGGGTVGIVRQGPTTDRTGFPKRLWRLTRGPQPGCILLTAPDDVRLRHSRNRLPHTPATALFALEREVVAVSPDDPVWRLRSINAAVSLRDAIDRLTSRGAIPNEHPLERGLYLPPDVDEHEPGGDVPDYMLPALLRPAEKRALDLLCDWPWLGLPELAGLLGVSRPRASKLIAALEGFGLVGRVPASGHRLALTDVGLAMLARRDRTAVGGAKKRWSAAPEDAGDWRSVSGRRSRQLLRDIEHTTAVHDFISALTVQARDLGWGIDQLDPPIRASRYFRHFGGRRSIHPDAFGILRRGDDPWPFFLEWERRAVRPITMAERLAPYLRYYSSHRPIDDHGARPAVLVVFHEDLAATHFLRVALEEMVRTRTPLPLLVSHRGLVEREGPLGRAWLAPGVGLEPARPLDQNPNGEPRP